MLLNSNFTGSEFPFQARRTTLQICVAGNLRDADPCLENLLPGFFTHGFFGEGIVFRKKNEAK